MPNWLVHCSKRLFARQAFPCFCNAKGKRAVLPVFGSTPLITLHLHASYFLILRSHAFYLLILHLHAFYLLIQVTFTLLPLMAPGGRIIVAASGLAELAIRWMNNETFTKLFSETSTEDASFCPLLKI